MYIYIYTYTYMHIFIYINVCILQLGDPTCLAKCSCSTGFAGDTCNATSTEYLEKVSLRGVLIEALLNVILTMDAEPNTVRGFGNSAVSLSQKPSELTNSSISSIAMIVRTVLTDAATLAIPYEQVSSVLSVLDSLGGVSGLTPTISTQLQAFPRLVLTQMNPQQFDEVYNFQSFKIIVSVKAVTGNKIAVSTPLTDEEVLAGVNSTSFSLSTAIGVTNVRVSLVASRLALINSALFPMVHSNPIQVSDNDDMIMMMIMMMIINPYPLAVKPYPYPHTISRYPYPTYPCAHHPDAGLL
jgi:hypothetical protein